MSRPCPGGGQSRYIDDNEYDRIVCSGSAREYHLVAAHPHAFCGCGNEAEACHPERCCEDIDGGVDCRHCSRGTGASLPPVTPEDDLADPLFDLT